MLYGGCPPKELRNKFLMAQDSDAAYLTAEVLPQGMELLPLAGHCMEMVGFRTADDVVYLADCVSSRETLEKYRIGYIYDVAAYLETLERVAAMTARAFVPAHAEVTEDIAPLARYNMDAVLEVGERITALCAQPATFEELLKGLFDHYGHGHELPAVRADRQHGAVLSHMAAGNRPRGGGVCGQPHAVAEGMSVRWRGRGERSFRPLPPQDAGRRPGRPAGCRTLRHPAGPVQVMTPSFRKKNGPPETGPDSGRGASSGRRCAAPEPLFWQGASAAAHWQCPDCRWARPAPAAAAPAQAPGRWLLSAARRRRAPSRSGRRGRRDPAPPVPAMPPHGPRAPA